MSAAKKRAPRTNETPNPDAEVAESKAGESEVNLTWHDHIMPHPAAVFYHKFSSDEQLADLADDIDKQKVIFDPVHTATVLGHSYVIDGVSRLDAIERTGRRTVDEKGNWVGMLDGRVIHHANKTDEEVWSIVTSLNSKRRHLTKAQIIEAADHMLKKKGTDHTTMTRSVTRGESGKLTGSTKDPHRSALRVQAETIAGEPISDSEIDRYLHHQLDQQKPKRKKKCPKKPVIFDEEFAGQAFRKWSQFLNNWDGAERREAKKVVDQCLPLFEQWPADKHAHIIVVMHRWLDWFNKRPTDQRTEVIRLMRKWLEEERAPDQQEKGANHEIFFT